MDRVSPRSLSLRSLQRLQQAAVAGLPLVERAAASAVAAGQYYGGQAASAGLPLVGRAAASAIAAGQYCGELCSDVERSVNGEGQGGGGGLCNGRQRDTPGGGGGGG